MYLDTTRQAATQEAIKQYYRLMMWGVMNRVRKKQYIAYSIVLVLSLFILATLYMAETTQSESVPWWIYILVTVLIGCMYRLATVWTRTELLRIPLTQQEIEKKCAEICSENFIGEDYFLFIRLIEALNNGTFKEAEEAAADAIKSSRLSHLPFIREVYRGLIYGV